jgi:hypothetical protein
MHFEEYFNLRYRGTKSAQGLLTAYLDLILTSDTSIKVEMASRPDGS